MLQLEWKIIGDGRVKNSRAQALIEFVLILPILIILLFAIVDFGNIFVTKSDLESKSKLAYDIISDNKDITEDDLKSKIVSEIRKNDSKINVTISFDNESELLNLKLTKRVNIITPGLNLIIGYPYNASVERVIKYDKQ